MSEQFNTPLPSVEFTPEELAEASAMRPLDAVPSNWIVKGDPSFTKFTPSVEGLAPADQKAVRELAGPNATGEQLQSALMGFLQNKRIEARIIAGAGPDATEPEREALEQLGQMRELVREHGKLQAELGEVVRYENSKDADGNPIAIPVYRYQGEAHARRTHRMAEIVNAITDLEGDRGKKAMEEAVRREAEKRRQLRTQVEEAAEVDRRAEAMVREERVNARAAIRANMLRN